jgi:hypothetical protein
MRKTTSAVAVALLSASLGAWAGGGDQAGQRSQPASTRAQVLDDLHRAIARDELPRGELGYRFVDAPSVRSRAEVSAEAREALRLGLIAHGELGASLLDAPSMRSRAEVMAEAGAAQRLGLLATGEAGPRPATPAEEAQIARAGREAAAQHAEAMRLSNR